MNPNAALAIQKILCAAKAKFYIVSSTALKGGAMRTYRL